MQSGITKSQRKCSYLVLKHRYWSFAGPTMDWTFLIYLRSLSGKWLRFPNSAAERVGSRLH